MKSKNVYINRTLNMKRIKYIGLDMDHTLIRYHSENFEALTHRVMLQKLVDKFDYPKSVLNLKFDFSRAIRGLVMDKKSGNLLKLSRFGAIRGSAHGLRPLDYKTQRTLYRSKYLDLNDPSYECIDTAFSLAIATLFSQMVDLKDGPEGKVLPDYAKINFDLNRVLDEAHMDGSLKDRVAEDVPQYIIKDPKTVEGIKKYVQHGKKVFIITNSDYKYSKLLLEYAIDPYLDGESWLDLFEFVITLASKPRFFYDNLKFFKMDPTLGTMQNLEGRLTPGLYQGGCASKFTDDLDLNPDEILYVGDHIYGDIVRLKKDCAWRTALVVEEIEREVESINATQELSFQIDELMMEKLPLETKVDELISRKIEKGESTSQKEIDEYLEMIAKIDAKISPLIKRRQEAFNTHWGEVMRVGIEESYFAYQVERFACIYMAKLTDLLEHSPRTYFRSSLRPMPHEV